MVNFEPIEKRDNEDLVILYSGGADSRLMAEFALKLGRKPFCVLVDYGQLHVRELDFAREQLYTRLNLRFQTVSIKDLGVESGLTGDGTKDITGTVNEMYVPGRNTIFLSIAFSIAESKGIDTIWIGSDWSDRIGLFPDCYQEYFVRVNEMFKFAGPKPIKVEAPLIGMSKEMVFDFLKYFDVWETEIFSGYGDL